VHRSSLPKRLLLVLSAIAALWACAAVVERIANASSAPQTGLLPERLRDQASLLCAALTLHASGNVARVLECPSDAELRRTTHFLDPVRTARVRRTTVWSCEDGGQLKLHEQLGYDFTGICWGCSESSVELGCSLGRESRRWKD